jgi:hypothetical protein
MDTLIVALIVSFAAFILVLALWNFKFTHTRESIDEATIGETTTVVIYSGGG